MFEISLKLQKYNFAIDRFYNEIANHLHMKDKLLSMFPPKAVFHYGSARQVSKPNILDSPFKLNSGKSTTDFDTFSKTDAIKFKTFVESLIYEIQEEMRKQTLEEIDKTAKATGNEVSKKENIWDMYIEAIEYVEMIFDKDGNPKLWLFPLDFWDKLSEIEPTTEQHQKINEIFTRKRGQYFAQKRIRRISLD